MRAPAGRDGPVLAFDTGGALGSVSVLGAAAARRPFLESDLEERVEILEPANRHGADLLPAIARLLRRVGVREGVPGLGRLAATRGPGSFTGLRVGLATLQGLALASGVPAVGVSALDAAALTDALVAPAAEGPRLIVLDALRGELFAAVYRGDGAGEAAAPASPEEAAGEPAPRRLSEPFRLVPADCGEWIRRFRVRRVAGPGVPRYREALLAAAADRAEVAGEVRPLAPAAARLAVAVPAVSDAAGERERLSPLYLRAPDIHGGA